MDINSAIESQINSVRQALGTATLQKAMSQDGATVDKLLEGMQETTEAVQKAVEAHRGNNIDVKV
jgi:molybdopterin converting factor small subunit